MAAFFNKFLSLVTISGLSLFLLIACSRAAQPESGSQPAEEPLNNESACGPGAGERQDIPLLPDAKLESKAGSFITYQTTTPLAQVVQFYQDGMTQQGWTTSGNNLIQADQADLIYTKTNTVAMLMLQQEAEGGTKIVISLNNPEAGPG
jgi:hypothetical protein